MRSVAWWDCVESHWVFIVSKFIVIIVFLVLLGVPFAFRPKVGEIDENIPTLVIMTPHNEQIRYEFEQGFSKWHQEHYGTPARIAWSVPGGTSEIRKMLVSQFTSSIERGESPGGEADLVFGGGSYEHSKLKKGVAGQSITAPIDFEQSWLDSVYGPNEIGGGRLYDPERYWFGAALSAFGIVYNRDVLRELNLEDPTTWVDLAQPELLSWVALVNPAQSGSVTTAFEAILQREGWLRGWQILRRAAANARSIAASSLKVPTEVSQGDAAMGVCIDFFGRYEAQAVRQATGHDRIGYIDPAGKTLIDADPISMLRNPPHPELARRFVQFALSDQGQAMWQFRVDDDSSDELGPLQFELRRLPALRGMYQQYMSRFVDQVNPFEMATPIEHPISDARSFIAIIFGAMAIDSGTELEEAWAAIINHPGFPTDLGFVTAADVSDPELKQMLELFDSMPSVLTPDGKLLSLADSANLPVINRGYLKNVSDESTGLIMKGAWWPDGMWNLNADPADMLRQQFGVFVRENCERIIEMAQQQG